MQSIYAASFLEKSSAKAVDKAHRKKINFNIGKYNAVVPKGKEQFTDLNRVKELAKKDRKSTRLNSSHSQQSRMPSSA